MESSYSARKCSRPVFPPPPHLVKTNAMPQKPSFKKISGFTLVEILVVISIIGALAAVSFVAVRSFRGSARMTACASNMRQIGVAMQLYADDHQGSYPDTSHTATPDTAWIYQLESYLGKFDQIRICPADPSAELRRKNKASSYILNSYVFQTPLDAFGEPMGTARNKLSMLPDPSRTILVFIASDRTGLYPGDDHTHSEQWSSWTKVISDIAPDRHKQKPSRNATKGYSNYLYADSSVRSISAYDIKEKIDKGNNIAAIPGVDP
ncbi:MAG: type II secretion system protein [Verrucomicrobiaceae bacterium]|nr:MAG: type II secretion system protein [Verrucomicrobiaceae bacterium]